MNRINTKKKNSNISKTSNGYKYFRKSYKLPTGKVIRLYAKTEEEWDLKLQEKIDDINKDLINPDCKVKDLKGQFLKDSEYLAPKTYQRREMHMRRDILKEYGDMKLRDIKTMHIRKYYNQVLREEGKNKVFEINNVLNQFFKWAIHNNFAIDTNPITEGLLEHFRKSISRLQAESEVENTEDVSYNLEDMVSIMNEVHGDPKEAIYSLQLQSGLRISEALAVKYSDIDLEKGIVKIRKQVTELYGVMKKISRWSDKGGKLIAPPKTKKSRREITLSKTLRRIVEETPTYERKGYLYTTKHGDVCTRSNWDSRHHKPLMKRLGLNLKTHDFRKFFASFHSEINTPISEVSEQMGHSSITTTLNSYTKKIADTKSTIDAISEITEKSTMVAISD